jgi:hypothetical protein
MILPSIFGSLFFILGVAFIIYGVRNGFLKRDIQRSHAGSRAYGNEAIAMGVIYIFGGIFLLWGFYVVVKYLFQ